MSCTLLPGAQEAAVTVTSGNNISEKLNSLTVLITEPAADGLHLTHALPPPLALVLLTVDPLSRKESQLQECLWDRALDFPALQNRKASWKETGMDVVYQSSYLPRAS